MQLEVLTISWLFLGGLYITGKFMIRGLVFSSDIFIAIGLLIIFVGVVFGIIFISIELLFSLLFIGMVILMLSYFAFSNAIYYSKVKIYKGIQEDECK